jgi:hypothetical protein
MFHFLRSYDDPGINHGFFTVFVKDFGPFLEQRFSRTGGGSNVSRQGENYYDQQDQSESSTGPVAPTGAIRPRWNRPDQEQD